MMRTAKFFFFLAVLSMVASAEDPERLTLAQAEEIALRNHPAIRAMALDSQAGYERVKQARSARFPAITALLTGVGADNGTRVAAGGLNNPIIYSRVATGVSITQTLYDFGRTGNLIDSTKVAAEAGDQRTEVTKADVLLAVRRAYYRAMRAESVLQVATATVSARQTVVDQVTELVKAQLKSILDQSFAETSLSEAKLLVASAENERHAAYLALSETLGQPSGKEYRLEDSSPTTLEPAALSEVQRKAIDSRPELKAMRLDLESARRFVSAEHALRYPTIGMLATAGYVPDAGPHLTSNYSAIGVNVAFPVFNGGLFSARESEAKLRAQAIDQRLQEMANRLMRDVSTAWLDMNTAYQRIQLTQQFVQQASQAMDLAQTRYDLGLSSIVELSQAQLTKTNAEIQNASARYEYQIRRAELNYQAGGI